MFQRSTELLREREVIYFDKAGKTFPEFKSQISPAEKKKKWSLHVEQTLGM